MTEILKLTNVRHSYAENSPLIEEFNLTVNGGEIVALAGKNGCGKTTLLKIAAGLLEPNSGEVEVCGQNPNDVRPSISFIFQDPTKQIIGTTVFEDVMFGLRNIQVKKEVAEEKTRDVMRELQIEHLANAPTFKLSGGEAQMVAIAGALVTNPKLLLADEATSMLDDEHREIFLNAINKRVKDGLCVVASTHDEKMLQIASQVVNI